MRNLKTKILDLRIKLWKIIKRNIKNKIKRDLQDGNLVLDKKPVLLSLWKKLLILIMKLPDK
jgi:hypothetical protein